MDFGRRLKNKKLSIKIETDIPNGTSSKLKLCKTMERKLKKLHSPWVLSWNSSNTSGNFLSSLQNGNNYIWFITTQGHVRLNNVWENNLKSVKLSIDKIINNIQHLLSELWQCLEMLLLSHFCLAGMLWSLDGVINM